ncbi:hypothetical protein Tco_1575070 [Tanacetum coccineum]
MDVDILCGRMILISFEVLKLQGQRSKDTLVGVASAVREGVTPSVVDMMTKKDKLSSLEDTTVPESFPPLSMPVSTVGNTPGKSSYANITGKPSGKKVNVRTLFTPGGNEIDVVVPVDSIRAISKRFANKTYGFFLGKKVAYPVVANYVRNTWGKYGLVRSMFSSSTGLFSFQFSSMDGLDAMLENGHVWVKLHGVPVTAFSEDSLSAITTKLADVELKDNTCNIHVEYEWKPPRCSSCKVFEHIHEECSKNTGAEYRPVPKKPTASSSGNKKKGVEPTIEVGNSNSFDVLNSVDNIVEFGTYRGLLIAILVDKDGNPLKEVEFPSEYDSEDEVASVDNDIARSMASEMVGFGTQSLLEQWRNSYGNGDYDDDPYDDDMYEGQDLSQDLQAICDNLDIRVRGLALIQKTLFPAFYFIELIPPKHHRETELCFVGLISVSFERSEPTECSNFKIKDLKINMLETRIKIMESRLKLERHPEDDTKEVAFAYQKRQMEKVLEESKRLEQEAMENLKAQEFLMDRRHVVDMLQREISCKCLDVNLLKIELEDYKETSEILRPIPQETTHSQDCEERLLKEKLELYDEDETEVLELIIQKTEYSPYDGCVRYKSKSDTIFKSYQKHQKKKATRKLNEELITEAVNEYEKHGCDALHGIPYTSYKSK